MKQLPLALFAVALSTVTAQAAGCIVEMPMRGTISMFSEFAAWNRAGANKGNGWHRGNDLWQGTGNVAPADQVGNPVVATDAGKVRWGGAGWLTLTRRDGAQARFGHLSKRYEQNNNVSAGQQIGAEGHTLISRGAGGTHLHFEFLVPGSILDTGGSTRVFMDGSCKTCLSSALLANQIKKVLPNTLYYVNPESFYAQRIPVVGSARARTGRSLTLDNTCSNTAAIDDIPASSSEEPSPSAAVSGEAEFRGAEIGTAQEQTNIDQKGLWVDFARLTALEARAMQIDHNDELSSAMAHYLLSTLDTVGKEESAKRAAEAEASHQ